MNKLILRNLQDQYNAIEDEISDINRNLDRVADRICAPETLFEKGLYEKYEARRDELEIRKRSLIKKSWGMSQMVRHMEGLVNGNV